MKKKPYMHMKNYTSLLKYMKSWQYIINQF